MSCEADSIDVGVAMNLIELLRSIDFEAKGLARDAAVANVNILAARLKDRRPPAHRSALRCFEAYIVTPWF